MARQKVNLVDESEIRADKVIALDKAECDTLEIGKGRGYSFEPFVTISVCGDIIYVNYWSNDGTRIVRTHGC